MFFPPYACADTVTAGPFDCAAVLFAVTERLVIKTLFSTMMSSSLVVTRLYREAQSAQVRLTLKDGTQKVFQAQVKVRRPS